MHDCINKCSKISEKYFYNNQKEIRKFVDAVIHSILNNLR